MKSLLCFGLFLFSLSTGASAPTEPIVIVALGDSLTEGYGLTKEEAYPALLQERLQRTFPQVKVINAGVSGSTSASGESRLKWQLKNKPQMLFLALGANDGLRGQNVDALKKNLDKTIQLAKANNVYVILAGMKIPLNYGDDYRKKYEAIFPALAKTHKVDLVPFLLEGVATNKALNLPDGIHPNAEGYKKIADALLPTFKTAITKLQEQKRP